MAVQTEDEKALEELRCACERSLEQWPTARAALLYGSRARGDHRPGSDWDVMLLTDGGGSGDCRLPDRLPLQEFAAERGAEVNVCAYGAERLRRRTVLAGSFDRSVARDSVLLAGHWTRPDLDKEDGMDVLDWQRHMQNALSKAAAAGDCCVRAREVSDILAAFNMYVQFMADSADAAERLAKAVLMRRGVTPRTVHDVAALAGQLQAERPGDTEAADLAGRLRRLNGDTKALHVAIYIGDVGADDGIRAVRRIGGVLELWAEELAEALADGDARIAELAGNLAKTAREISRLSAARLRTLPNREWPEGRSQYHMAAGRWPAAVREMDEKANELHRSWEGFTGRMRTLQPTSESPKPKGDGPSPF